MKMRRLAGTAMLAIAALGLGAGTAYADPGPSINKIGYETKLVDKTVVTTIDGGFFEVVADGKTVDLEDSAGNVVVNLPLTANLENIAIPLKPVVKNDGKVLELTPEPLAPSLMPTKPLYLKPVASLLENQRAQEGFATQFGIATAIGGFAGTAIGAVLGGLLLSPTCLIPPFLTCIPFVITGAGLGAIIGTVAIGGPALAIAGFDLIATLNAPPGTTKWNYPTPTE